MKKLLQLFRILLISNISHTPKKAKPLLIIFLINYMAISYIVFVNILLKIVLA